MNNELNNHVEEIRQRLFNVSDETPSSPEASITIHAGRDVIIGYDKQKGLTLAAFAFAVLLGLILSANGLLRAALDVSPVSVISSGQNTQMIVFCQNEQNAPRDTPTRTKTVIYCAVPIYPRTSHHIPPPLSFYVSPNTDLDYHHKTLV